MGLPLEIYTAPRSRAKYTCSGSSFRRLRGCGGTQGKGTPLRMHRVLSGGIWETFLPKTASHKSHEKTAEERRLESYSAQKKPLAHSVQSAQSHGATAVSRRDVCSSGGVEHLRGAAGEVCSASGRERCRDQEGRLGLRSFSQRPGRTTGPAQFLPRIALMMIFRAQSTETSVVGKET